MEKTVSWNRNNVDPGVMRDTAPTGRDGGPNVRQNNDRTEDVMSPMSMPNGDPPSLVLWGEGEDE